jgi:hypothetical protein
MRILYTVRGTSSENRSDFRDRILAYARDALAPLAESAIIAVSEEAPPAHSMIPFRNDLMALVSLDGLPSEPSWPDPPPGFNGAWESEVAFPVVHERTWPLGERSPGAGLLTFLRRKEGLAEEEFLRRWFEGHTPLTLEVHPNVGYVRNRVLRTYPVAGPVAAEPLAPLSEKPGESESSGSPEPWDGIVEEQYAPSSDLLNPARFFGGSLFKMPRAMLRVYHDVKGFLDYPSIRSWLTAEYRLK